MTESRPPTIGIIKVGRDEFRDILGEGFHTGLRKATDSSAASRAWRAIDEMPGPDWAAVLDFVINGMESMGIIAFDKLVPLKPRPATA